MHGKGSIGDWRTKSTHTHTENTYKKARGKAVNTPRLSLSSALFVVYFFYGRKNNKLVGSFHEQGFAYFSCLLVGLLMLLSCWPDGWETLEKEKKSLLLFVSILHNFLCTSLLQLAQISLIEVHACMVILWFMIAILVIIISGGCLNSFSLLRLNTGSICRSSNFCLKIYLKYPTVNCPHLCKRVLKGNCCHIRRLKNKMSTWPGLSWKKF